MMPGRTNRILSALSLIVLAGLSAWYGSTLDGHILGRLWRGTVFIEIGVILIAAAVWLAARPLRHTRFLICLALAGVAIFAGAQHFARAARRNAMADGTFPATLAREPETAVTVEEIRNLFNPCLTRRNGQLNDDFYELELGLVPPSKDNPAPRWLLTQPYPPMDGVPRGFLIARAYLNFKSSTLADPENRFSGEIAALGLDPQPFLDALTAASKKRTTPNDVSPDQWSPEATSSLVIPEHSTSVLSYAAHEIPEIRESELNHPDAIEIDPANLHEMNYGWELMWVSRKHPRICLHTREGAGDIEGQSAGVGDFHGLHRNSDLSHLVYDFKVERPGLYRLNALIFPEAEKCSNYPQAAIDDENYYDLGHNDCVPYAWYNADWKGGSALLGTGWHQLHLHFMQDGITIARFWLTRIQAEDSAFAGAESPPAHPKLELILNRRSMAILSGESADFGAWVCNTGGLSGPAALDAQLDPGRGRPLVKFHQDIELDPNVSVKEFPISLTLPPDLPAREMRVTVTLSEPKQKLNIVRESTVIKPFPALLLGPIERPHDKELSIFEADYLAPKPEDFKSAAAPSTAGWGRFPAKAITYYGLYDLNRAFGGGSYDGIFFSRAYVAVRVNVPKDGQYLFKMMGDDVLSVWLDGAHIYTSERKGPPIRYPGTTTQSMKAGEHLMVMHVDQTTGWWQCGVHLRTAEDDVCDIEGVEERN